MHTRLFFTTTAAPIAALIITCGAMQLDAQAPKPGTTPAKSTTTDSARPRKDSAAYPTSGTSAAARALAGRPAPIWPVPGPAPLAGSILPAKRIIAYYGNPFSKRMGVLGEYPKPEMLQRLDREVAAWTKADPGTPVQPALHLITTVAQGDAGKDGKYRMRHSDALTEKVYGWAKERNALLFLDVQVGLSTIQEELPRLESWLAKPDVHFGMDPEFSIKDGTKPGKKIGSYDAADVNWVIDQLARIVSRYKLPPKVLVVHRFTKPMLTNASKIKRDPRVQVVIHMDGWGPPSLKRDSYAAYVYAEPVQFTGFKLFYKNDRKYGGPMMTPSQLLALTPKPLYIQYQ